MASPADGQTVIKLSELAKNIDINNDGKIDKDEQKILDTLKAMDIDGDGDISLKELVNLGKKLNVADAQTTTYKRILFFLMGFMLMFAAGTFLLCLGAVEAAKDSKPDGGGTLLTTSVTGKSKVVRVQKHTTSIKITDLWSATFTTLDGVKNMGFQVGTAFYSYTVTGFQQDLKADGKSSVRFYTSRGDTIYVSATAATLELKAGGTVDIAAAQTLTRHLLSTRDLLALDDAPGTNAKATSDGSCDDDCLYDENQMTAMAGTYNSTAATAAATESYPANLDQILSDECNRVGAHPYFTEPDEYGCKCNPGFTGAIATVFSGSTVNATGSCVRAPQPAGSNCWMDTYWKKGDVEGEKESNATKCHCPYTHQGDLKWNSTNGVWEGACTVRPNVPKAFTSPEKNFVLKSTYKWTDSHGLVYEAFSHFCPPTFDNGHVYWQPDYDDSTNMPTGTGKWDSQMCQPVECPYGSTKDNSTSPARCKCMPQYFGDGFTWQDGTSDEMWNRFWKPVDSAYTNEMSWMACTHKLDKMYGGKDCPQNSHFDEATGTCKCAQMYTGSVTWDNMNNSWTGSCTAAPCPANTVEMTSVDRDTGESRRWCECDYSYTGTVTWNTTNTAFKSTCVPTASCPVNTIKDPALTAPYDCICAPTYEGTVNYYTYNNSYVSTCKLLVCGTNQVVTENTCGGVTTTSCQCAAGRTGSWSQNTATPTLTCT